MHLWFQRGAAWASKKGWKNAKALDRNDVKKIAIIRHGAIGDQVVTRVFINEARRFFPNAEITLSLDNTRSYGAPVDMADHVHMVDKKIEGKKTSFLSRYKQIKALGEHDIIFDLAGTSLAKWICLFATAKLKIGFPYRQIENYFYDVTVKRSDMVLETENMLHQLYILGAKTLRPFDYGYPDYGLESENPYIVYFTSASNEGKTWPKAKFIELGEMMAGSFPQYRHIFLDGLLPHEKVDDIINALSSFNNVQKQEVLGYEEAMKFLSRATMVISNDTGVRNMAVSVNTPTVGIFFATIPYRYWPRDGMHEIAFAEDHTIPAADFVYETSADHLKKVTEAQ